MGSRSALGKKLVISGKDVLGIIWEDTRTSHGKGEEGWMAVGGAGDSSPLLCVQGWKVKAKRCCPDSLWERKGNRGRRGAEVAASGIGSSGSSAGGELDLDETRVGTARG